ncbi:MAG: hypothetical protein ACHQJ6_08565 [Candidatus Berkiellales bacterium]
MRELTYNETLAIGAGITNGTIAAGAITAVIATIGGWHLSDTTGDSSYVKGIWLYTGASLGLLAGGIIDQNPCLGISGSVLSLFSGVLWLGYLTRPKVF